MKPTKISFEIPYGDNSSVQFGVCYDSTDPLTPIHIKSVGTIEFPVEKLKWLIDALQEIETVIEESK